MQFFRYNKYINFCVGCGVLKQTKGTVAGLLEMSEVSYCIFRGTLLLTITFLFCAFLLIIDAGKLDASTYDQYQMAVEMIRTPAGLLLISGIGILCMEERFSLHS